MVVWWLCKVFEKVEFEVLELRELELQNLIKMKMKEDIVEDEDEVMKMCWVDLLVLLERENENVREREGECHFRDYWN